jgi:hypothetical protein
MRNAAAITALVFAAGCVTEPDTPHLEGCERDEECAPGFMCIENACFAQTSRGEFAAELFAPQSRSDMLARAEIQMLGISADNKTELMFAQSIEVTGRVLLRATDQASIAARLTFRRASRIPGASDYVVNVNAAAGKRAGEMAFQVRLLPNLPGESYEVTIYPDDGTLVTPPAGQPPPSALAPPQTIEDLSLTTSASFDVPLDRGGVRGVTGQVVDAVGVGIPGMIVRAYGQRTTSEPRELVSSTGKTDADGRFEIYLPTGRAGLFDLRVTPGPGVRAASLERKGVRPATTALTSGLVAVEPVRYPALPLPVRYQLPVAGADAAGGRKPALGAAVSFRSTLLVTATDEVTYETQTEVGTSGLAEVDLVPGVLEQNRTYEVTVLPLANTLQGARWDATLSIGPQGGVLAELDLPSRVLVSGTVRDADGKPVNKVTVRPQLTSTFVPGSDLVGLRLPEVTTNEAGQFSVFLDGQLAGVAAEYDLELIPPGGSGLPRWSRDRVSPPGDQSRVDLGDLALPAASLVSGIVRDEMGAPVADAEIRVYMRDGSAMSRQRALAKSDAEGKIELVLPAP